MLPSPVVDDRCFRPRLRPHVEELVEREVVDLKLERRVIRTVWDSSSSIRWPRLSVTLLSSFTAPTFSRKSLSLFTISMSSTWPAPGSFMSPTLQLAVVEGGNTDQQP